MDAVSKNQKTTKGFKMKIDYKFEYQADFQKRRAK